MVTLKSENQVEADIARFMADRRWTRHRNHVGVFTTTAGRVSVGIPGEPDWTFKRPVSRGVIQICHCEAKAEGIILKLPPRLPKYNPKQLHDKRQLERIALLNHQGEPAAWSNSVEMWTEFYMKEFPNG